MRWNSSRISASACFGAFRSRFRSLLTQQRCTAARGHTSPTARPSITVDDRQHRRPQRARDEIVEAALPRLEGLAPARLQGEELFAPVSEDADDAQHRDADDLPGTTHPQEEAIEIQIDHVDSSERARPFYPVRHYRDHRQVEGAGHYSAQLRRDITDIIRLELPHLARELTIGRVTAAIQRYVETQRRQQKLRGRTAKRPKP
jgi:hypothetical protein